MQKRERLQKLKRRRSEECIDVYTAPTLDVRSGRRVLGGPLYYARRALERIEPRVSVRWPFACMGRKAAPYTMFDVQDDMGVKRLRLLSYSRWDCPIPRCSAALFSPVYHDYPLHILAYASLYRYCILDVQGLTRIAGWKGGTVTRRAGILWWQIPQNNNCIVKIGFDDLNSIHEVQQLLDLLKPKAALFTSNGHGFTLINFEQNTVMTVEVKRVNVEAVGAGDMFNSILLARLIKGDSLEASALMAAEAVAQILEGSDPRLDEVVDVRRLRYVKSVRVLPCAGCYLNEIVLLARD